MGAINFGCRTFFILKGEKKMECDMDFCRFRKNGECTKENPKFNKDGECLDFEGYGIGLTEEDYERMKKGINLVIT